MDEWNDTKKIDLDWKKEPEKEDSNADAADWYEAPDPEPAMKTPEEDWYEAPGESGKESAPQEAPAGQSDTWGKVRWTAKTVASWTYKLRSVLLAIPVVVMAITEAVKNMSRLPDAVGLNLLANGEYQFMVGKGVAVLGPLTLTAVCLLLMFSSRKVVYPWIISLFTLVLPWLIWITNVFPA